MRFTATGIEGVLLVEPEILRDERGFFARTWSAEEFAANGLPVKFDQSNVSQNKFAGTLRGLHYQAEPYAETKLVRCIRGSIFDVAVDLRADSPTFLRWTSATLTAANRAALYIPVGCAHGFQSLEDDTEVLYLMAGAYHAEAARTVAWNDRQIGITWPACDRRILSKKDADAEPFRA